MSFRDRVVAESHAEGIHHLGRAKRWGVYLTGGMVALALSLMLFTAIHLGIGVDPAEAKGALLIRVLRRFSLPTNLGRPVN